MRASLQIIITGCNDGIYASVTVTALSRNDDNETRIHELYHEQHLAQDLPDTMSVEAWGLATLCQHTDLIKERLARDIQQGSKTLMLDVPVFQ